MHSPLPTLLNALQARGVKVPLAGDQLQRDRIRVAILTNHLELEPVDDAAFRRRTFAEVFRLTYGEFLDRRAVARDAHGRPRARRMETPQRDPDDGGEDDEEDVQQPHTKVRQPHTLRLPARAQRKGWQ